MTKSPDDPFFRTLFVLFNVCVLVDLSPGTLLFDCVFQYIIQDPQ